MTQAEILDRIINGNLPGYPAPLHHVAEAILASDWLKARLAAAWDEGWTEGKAAGKYDPTAGDNPYRADQKR